MRSRSLAALLAALLLGGCSGFSLGPFFDTPKVEPPASFEAADAAPVWPGAEWWQGFRSPELNRLIADAMAGNRDLKAALRRIDEAEANVRIAGAALLPTLAAGGSAQRSDRGGNTRGGASNSYQTSLQASYQVDLFGANRASAEAAEARLASSRFDRETVAITLVADTARAYFQALSARDRRQIAESLLRNAESILDLLEETARVGTSSALEVAQQRSAVASQRAALPGLILSERQALSALAVLLGRNPQGFTVTARSLDEIVLLPVAAGIPSELLLRRPDLRRAEAELEAALRETQAARAARFPTLDLTGEGGLASTALSRLLTSGSLLYSLAASISAPIFAGGRLEAQEDFSTARFQELAENYQQAALLAFQDVQNALDASEQNAREYDLRREAFAQAREAYRLAELRYRAGTATFLTVLQAQQSVFQAADSVLQLQFAQFSSTIDLYTALGGGWPGTPAGE
jgi:NodT family efflux transporter outer membrane factor (OMF) lipoprotein